VYNQQRPTDTPSAVFSRTAQFRSILLAPPILFVTVVILGIRRIVERRRDPGVMYAALDFLGVQSAEILPQTPAKLGTLRPVAVVAVAEETIGVLIVTLYESEGSTDQLETVLNGCIKRVALDMTIEPR